MNRIISKEPTVIEMGSLSKVVDSGYLINDILSVSHSEKEGKVSLRFLDTADEWIVNNDDWDYASYSELGDA